MKLRPTDLPGVLLFDPVVHGDTRGFFFESFRADALAAAGVAAPFVQDNHSCSSRGTLRGLHYQLQRPQGKLVRVLRGSIFDAVVDIRAGSPTFGKYFGATLSAANKVQMYVPPGFAHGFAALEDDTEVLYKCTDYYSGASDQMGVLWNDPAVGIPWPIKDPLLSDKDTHYAGLDKNRADLPQFVSR